jgi:phage gpG-like protein
MTETRVEFVGAGEAMADMRRWADQVAPAVARAGEPFAQTVARTVAGVVPVVSGALRNSIDTGTDADAVTVSIGSGLAYAGWIEFGGSRGRPYVPNGRYLYPSAHDAQDEYAAMAAAAADDTVGSFAWS